MTGVEPVPRARSQRSGNVSEDTTYLVSSACEGATRPRGVFDEKACLRLDALERIYDRLRDALRGFLGIAVGRRARVKADESRTDRIRALELLRETIASADPFLLFRRRRVQHVRRVHDHTLRRDLRLGERILEARDSLRTNGNLVAVVLGD